MVTEAKFLDKMLDKCIGRYGQAELVGLHLPCHSTPLGYHWLGLTPMGWKRNHFCAERLMLPWRNDHFSLLLCCFRVSEMKMEDILANLVKDDRFKGHQWGNKVSYFGGLELLWFHSLTMLSRSKKRVYKAIL